MYYRTIQLRDGSQIRYLSGLPIVGQQPGQRRIYILAIDVIVITGLTLPLEAELLEDPPRGHGPLENAGHHRVQSAFVERVPKPKFSSVGRVIGSVFVGVGPVADLAPAGGRTPRRLD